MGRSDQTTIEREEGSVCDDIAGKGKTGVGTGERMRKSGAVRHTPTRGRRTRMDGWVDRIRKEMEGGRGN